MLHHYFQQKNMNPFSNFLETPVKDLMDLNMKAFQRFSYLMPNELLNLRRPEDVIEKNLEVFVESGHTALAYMQTMFDIMEHHWLKNFETTLKTSKEFNGLSKDHLSTKATHTGREKKNKQTASSRTKVTTKPKASSTATIPTSTASKSKLVKAKKLTATSGSNLIKKPAIKSSSAQNKPTGLHSTTDVKHSRPLSTISDTSSQKKS